MCLLVSEPSYCGFFSQAGHNELKVHLATLLQDFGASLVSAMESHASSRLDTGPRFPPPARAPPPPPALTVPGDAPAPSERIQAARARKSAGDFALLAGSPADAGRLFQGALVVLSAEGDDAWAGAALQGAAAAALLGPAQEGFLAPYSEQADAPPEVAQEVARLLGAALESYTAASGADHSR